MTRRQFTRVKENEMYSTPLPHCKYFAHIIFYFVVCFLLILLCNRAVVALDKHETSFRLSVRSNNDGDFGFEESTTTEGLPTTTSSSVLNDQLDSLLPEYSCGPVPLTEDTEALCKLPEGSTFTKCPQNSPVWTTAEVRCKNNLEKPTTTTTNETLKKTCIDGQSWQPADDLTCHRQPDCGVIVKNIRRKRVANGNIAQPQTFPWHAAIFVKQKKKLTYACGGTLIHPRLVITSAADVSNDPSENFVVLNAKGRDFHRNKIDKSAQLRRVKAVLKPDPFNGLAPNIVLLELTHSLEINEHVLPACVPESLDDPQFGSVGQFPGFGMDQNNKFPNGLRFVSMPVVHPEVCLKSPGITLSVDEFCAGYKNGTAACAGDNGGGLVFIKNGRYSVKGILSLRTQKSRAKRNKCDHNYSVFTSLTFYLDWVTTIMEKTSVNEEPTKMVLGKFANATVRRERINRAQFKSSVPWMAEIYEIYNGRFLYSCSGTLIHPQFIITSASCFPENDRDPGKFRLFLAPRHCEMKDNAADTTPVLASVESITVHPKYVASTLLHNLALVKLTTAVPKNESQVSVATLSADEMLPGQTATIAGCYFQPNGSVSELVQDQLTVLAERECIATLGQASPAERQFCALSNSSEIIPRKLGSSGLIRSQEGPTGFTLEGVFSAGRNEKGVPTVFSYIGRYKQWIEATIHASLT